MFLKWQRRQSPSARTSDQNRTMLKIHQPDMVNSIVAIESKLSGVEGDVSPGISELEACIATTEKQLQQTQDAPASPT